MKKKIVWVVVSGWMVAALLLTSCAPSVVEEAPKAETPKAEVPKEKVAPEVVVPKEGSNMVKWTGTKLDGTTVETLIERPQYGGVHIVMASTAPQNWDDITRQGADSWALDIVNELVFTRDWTRGPLGTKEWLGQIDLIPAPGTIHAGALAESWEILPEPDTLIFHIRQGVHWALDPDNEASRLMGGRELTAADIVHSLRRQWSIGYPAKNYRYLVDMDNLENSIYVSPDDPWAIILKTKAGSAGWIFRTIGGHDNKIFAPEVTEKYGNPDITNWEHSVGTGPFILKNYISGSAVSYERNDNYYVNDPFFPENQLPYLDGFRILIIPDPSTQLAALRTGKVDTGDDVGNGNIEITKDQADLLRESNPELRWVKYLGIGGGMIHMRTDVKPLDDIRVRQALAMAINNPELVDVYYGGDAELLVWPVVPISTYMHLYTPLEEMPELVQDMYGYHPDKAKLLLAEAGYPDGFETEIIATPAMVDWLSIVKDYWSKIGVDLNIEVRDYSVHRTIRRKNTHKQMFAKDGALGLYSGVYSSHDRAGGGNNQSITEDPWHQTTWDLMIQNYFDPVEQSKIVTEPMAEGMPSWNAYELQQAYIINLPQPYKYLFWQPWLKGYEGVKYASIFVDITWPKYVWIDQELKESMGR